jgi:hypothetical protein
MKCRRPGHVWHEHMEINFSIYKIYYPVLQEKMFIGLRYLLQALASGDNF